MSAAAAEDGHDDCLAPQHCANYPILCQSTDSDFSGPQYPRAIIQRQILPVVYDRHLDNALSCEGHHISTHPFLVIKVLFTIALTALVVFGPHVNPNVPDVDPIVHHCHCVKKVAAPIHELCHDANNCLPLQTDFALVSVFDPCFNHNLTQISQCSGSSSFFHFIFLRLLVFLTSLSASLIVMWGDSNGPVPFCQTFCKHFFCPFSINGSSHCSSTADEFLCAIDGLFARFQMWVGSHFLRSAAIFCHGFTAPSSISIISIFIMILKFVARSFHRCLRHRRLQINRSSVQKWTACAVFAFCTSTLPQRIDGQTSVRTPEACNALMLCNCVWLRGGWF
jgi:hypothetical protein